MREETTKNDLSNKTIFNKVNVNIKSMSIKY